MTSSWTTRIKSRMRELDLTQEALANKMGITRGAITHYLSGRRKPPLKQFQKLAAILKCDPAWLMFGTSAADNKQARVTKNDKSTTPKRQLPILSWDQITEFGKASKIETKEYVPHFFTDQEDWYGLQVKGDSMISGSTHTKGYYEGDIIIIDPNKAVTHGSCVIAMLPRSKEATFKQYVVDGGIRYLKPLNPQYPITKIDESTHICGIVIGCLSLTIT